MIVNNFFTKPQFSEYTVDYLFKELRLKSIKQNIIAIKLHFRGFCAFQNKLQQVLHHQHGTNELFSDRLNRIDSRKRCRINISAAFCLERDLSSKPVRNFLLLNKRLQVQFKKVKRTLN